MRSTASDADRPFWDRYARFFEAEEERVYPPDYRELAFYNLLRERCPGPCLELGCGYGRLTTALSGSGPVYGLDVSRLALSLMGREAAALMSPVAALAQRIPFRSKSFDAVLFPYNGIHCIPDREDRRSALREAARTLAGGGYFCIEACPAFEWRAEEKDVERYHVERYDIDLRLVESVLRPPDRRTIIFRMEYSSSQHPSQTMDLELAIIDEQELAEDLEAAGLRIEEEWGDYDMSEYDGRLSPRLILLARNP